MKKNGKLDGKRRRVNEDEDLDLDLGTDTDPATQEPESPGEPEDGDEESINTLKEDTYSVGNDAEDEIPGQVADPEDEEEAAFEAAEENDDDEDDSDDEDDDDDDEDDEDEDDENKPWESRKRRLSEAFSIAKGHHLFTFIPESHQHKPVTVVAESREMATRIVKAALVKEGILKDQKQALPEGEMVRTLGVYEAVTIRKPAARKLVKGSKDNKRVSESRSRATGFGKLSSIVSRV